jgi:hypothetical protein
VLSRAYIPLVIIVIILLLLVVYSGLIPLRRAKKFKKLSLWDYVYPYTGFLAWFVLLVLRVGNRPELGNLIWEPLLLLIFSAVLPWLVLRQFQGQKPLSQGKILLLQASPLVMALFFRLFMPDLGGI